MERQTIETWGRSPMKWIVCACRVTVVRSLGVQIGSGGTAGVKSVVTNIPGVGVLQEQDSARNLSRPQHSDRPKDKAVIGWCVIVTQDRLERDGGLRSVVRDRKAIDQSAMQVCNRRCAEQDHDRLDAIVRRRSSGVAATTRRSTVVAPV